MTKKKDQDKIDAGHKHEILDRVHCMNAMFEELIATHPAAALMEKEIKKARKAINELYQKAGAVHFEPFEFAGHQSMPKASKLPKK